MKKKALTLALAMATLMSYAATGKSLVVSFNDGTKVEFALATTPNVSFADDKMTVTTSSTTASYDLWKVSTFTYTETDGIDNVTTESLTMQGNKIIVDSEDCKVSAYSLDGKEASVTSVSAGGKTVVGLDTLHNGTYIVKINDKAIKITRR